MKFEKGKSKTGGRAKGTPNHLTTSIRQKLLKLVDSSFEVIQVDLNSLPPQERINTFFRFLDYVIPKPKDMNIDLSNLSQEEIEQLIDIIITKQNE